MPEPEQSHREQSAPRPAWREFAGRAAVLWLFGGFWFFSAVNPTRTNDFSDYDILLLGALSAFVFAAQTAGAAVLTFFRAPPNIVLSVFAVFLAANFYYLSLVLIDEISGMHPAAQFLIAAASAGVFAVCLRAMENVRVKYCALGAGALLFGYAAGGQAAYQADVRYFYRAGAKQIAAGGMTSSPAVRAVEFQNKPNVYFLSFDGLIPGALARGLGVNFKDFAFEGVLRRGGFRVFRNHFSAAGATRPGLNLILAMDVAHYDKLWKVNSAFSPFQGAYAMYSGLTPSPLLEIFRANGYTVRTFAYDRYLGGQQGPHVDEFIRPSGSSVCASMANFKLFNAFYRFCPMLVVAARRDWFGIRTNQKFRRDGLYDRRDADKLLAAIAKTAASDAPGFLFSYVAVPGHTMAPYHADRPETHAAALAAYHVGAEESAAVIARILDFIRRKDPDAVVYIFGDHGVHFHRGRNPEGDAKIITHVRDAYGAYGAIYPAAFCADMDDKPYSPGYITAPEVARHIVRCLAGGEDAVRGGYTEDGYPLVIERAQRGAGSTRITISGGFKNSAYE